MALFVSVVGKQSQAWRKSDQSVTYRYREFPVPGIFIFLVVSEPVSEKFGTGKKYRYRYRKNLVPEKSTGIGIGKIWYRKKVSEPVSEKFGTGKSIGTGTGKKLI